MSNFVIPAVLIATILIAGIFALQQIEEASTVHTTIGTNIDDQNRAMTWTIEGAAGDNIIIPAGNLLTGTATLSMIDGTGTCELRTAAAVDDDGPIDNIALGTTGVGALAAQDGASITIQTSIATCTLTIFIETAGD